MFKRGKRKILADYGIKDIYKHYKNTTEDPVSYKLFVECIKEFNKLRLHRLIYHNEGIRFPAKTGGLFIKMKSSSPIIKDGKVDKGKIPVDWKATLKLWANTYPDKTPEQWKDIPDKKLLFHLNKHFDNKTAYFYWDKTTSNVKNQSAYRIELSRLVKRELNFAIKTNKNLIYYE